MLQLSHKNLDVYKMSLTILAEIYDLTRKFPKEELYVLSLQLRMAALSVCSNLAEGSSRFSKAEKRRFYEISRSSLVEVDTQIEVSLRLKYAKPGEIEILEKHVESVFKMISKMIANLCI